MVTPFQVRFPSFTQWSFWASSKLKTNWFSYPSRKQWIQLLREAARKAEKSPGIISCDSTVRWNPDTVHLHLQPPLFLTMCAKSKFTCQKEDTAYSNYVPDFDEWRIRISKSLTECQGLLIPTWLGINVVEHRIVFHYGLVHLQPGCQLQTWWGINFYFNTFNF